MRIPWTYAASGALACCLSMLRFAGLCRPEGRVFDRREDGWRGKGARNAGGTTLERGADALTCSHVAYGARGGICRRTPVCWLGRCLRQFARADVRAERAARNDLRGVRGRARSPDRMAPQRCRICIDPQFPRHSAQFAGSGLFGRQDRRQAARSDLNAAVRRSPDVPSVRHRLDPAVLPQLRGHHGRRCRVMAAFLHEGGGGMVRAPGRHSAGGCHDRLGPEHRVPAGFCLAGASAPPAGRRPMLRWGP